MLYAMMNKYKSLLSEAGLRRTTIDTYFYKMVELTHGQNPLSNDFDLANILDNLSKIKNRGAFIQSKSALLHLCRCFNIILEPKHWELINKLQNKTIRKPRNIEKLSKTSIDNIKQTIKSIKNEKLKISYEFALSTGLRVSEVASLTPAHATFFNDCTKFTFIQKGGTTRTINIKKNEAIFLPLNRYIESMDKTAKTKKIFYSANYLQTNAKKLGFKCHDLRRICAKDEYRKTKSKYKVKQKLGHTKIKNTNIYLKS